MGPLPRLLPPCARPRHRRPGPCHGLSVLALPAFSLVSPRQPADLLEPGIPAARSQPPALRASSPVHSRTAQNLGPLAPACVSRWLSLSRPLRSAPAVRPQRPEAVLLTRPSCSSPSALLREAFPAALLKPRSCEPPPPTVKLSRVAFASSYHAPTPCIYVFAPVLSACSSRVRAPVSLFLCFSSS